MFFAVALLWILAVTAASLVQLTPSDVYPSSRNALKLTLAQGEKYQFMVNTSQPFLVRITLTGTAIGVSKVYLSRNADFSTVDDQEPGGNQYRFGFSQLDITPNRTGVFQAFYFTVANCDGCYKGLDPGATYDLRVVNSNYCAISHHNCSSCQAAESKSCIWCGYLGQESAGCVHRPQRDRFASCANGAVSQISSCPYVANANIEFRAQTLHFDDLVRGFTYSWFHIVNVSRPFSIFLKTWDSLDITVIAHADHPLTSSWQAKDEGSVALHIPVVQSSEYWFQVSIYNHYRDTAPLTVELVLSTYRCVSGLSCGYFLDRDLNLVEQHLNVRTSLIAPGQSRAFFLPPPASVLAIYARTTDRLSRGQGRIQVRVKRGSVPVNSSYDLIIPGPSETDFLHDWESAALTSTPKDASKVGTWILVSACANCADWQQNEMAEFELRVYRSSFCEHYTSCFCTDEDVCQWCPSGSLGLESWTCSLDALNVCPENDKYNSHDFDECLEFDKGYLAFKLIVVSASVFAAVSLVVLHRRIYWALCGPRFKMDPARDLESVPPLVRDLVRNELAKSSGAGNSVKPGSQLRYVDLLSGTALTRNHLLYVAFAVLAPILLLVAVLFGEMHSRTMALFVGIIYAVSCLWGLFLFFWYRKHIFARRQRLIILTVDGVTQLTFFEASLAIKSDSVQVERRRWRELVDPVVSAWGALYDQVLRITRSLAASTWSSQVIKVGSKGSSKAAHSHWTVSTIRHTKQVNELVRSLHAASCEIPGMLSVVELVDRELAAETSVVPVTPSISTASVAQVEVAIEMTAIQAQDVVQSKSSENEPIASQHATAEPDSKSTETTSADASSVYGLYQRSDKLYAKLPQQVQKLYEKKKPIESETSADASTHDVDSTILTELIASELAKSDKDEKAEDKFVSSLPVDPKIDWNDEYQKLYERPVDSPFDGRERANELTALVNKFVAFSETTSRLIVSENQGGQHIILPPVNKGGLAGGVKFVYGNVLFKFARDDKGIYGGNEELAQKAARCEIRNMNALIDLNLFQLHTTLSSFFCIRGHGIIATALAPLGSQTIVHGTEDAGATFFDKSTTIRSLFKQVATAFNLKPHQFLTTKSQETYECLLVADVEGHEGKDGRCYIVDLARLMPCTTPRPDSCDFLSFMFRPEFMRTHTFEGALSADACTGFGHRQPDQDIADSEDNASALAFLKLIATVIPSTAALLSQQQDTSSQALSRLMHSHGVNMRYLGVLRSCCIEDSVRSMLLREMVARVLKSLTLQVLRNSRGRSIGSVFRAVWSVAMKPDSSMLCDEVNRKFWPAQISTDEFSASWDAVVASLPLKSDLIRRVLAGLGAKEPTADCDVVPLVTDPNNAVAFNALFEPAIRHHVHPAAFVDLKESEQQLVDTLAIRERTLGENSPQLLSTLLSLIKLYRVWAKESPADSFAAGQKLCERVQKIDSSPSSLLDCAAFFNAFGKFQDSYRLSASALEHAQGCSFTRDDRGRIDRASLDSQLKQLLLATKTGDDTLRSLHELAASYFDLGEFRLQYSVLKVVYAVKRKQGASGVELASALDSLGIASGLVGDLKQQRALLEQALSLREKLLGQEHPEVANSLSHLGSACMAENDRNAAIAFLERALAIREKAFGVDHPSVALVCRQVGDAYCDVDDMKRGRVLLERALAIQEKALGPHHPEVAMTAVRLARPVWKLGESDLAIKMIQRALSAQEKSLGSSHPVLIETCRAFAVFQDEQRHYKRSAELLERALEISEQNYGPDHPSLGAILTSLGAAYLASDAPEKAISVIERALTLKMRLDGPEHHDVGIMLRSLGVGYAKLKEYQQAKKTLESSLRILEKSFDQLEVSDTLFELSKALCKLDQHKKERELLHRCVAITEAALTHQQTETDRRLGDRLLALADMYEEFKEWRKKRDVLTKAVALLEKSAPNDVHLAHAYYRLADCHRYFRNPAKSAPMYKFALSLYAHNGTQTNTNYCYYAVEGFRGARAALQQELTHDEKELIAKVRHPLFHPKDI